MLIVKLRPKAAVAAEAAVAEAQGWYSKADYAVAEAALVVAEVVLHLWSMVLAAAAEVVGVLRGLRSTAVAVAVAVVFAVVAAMLCPKVADVVVAAAAAVAALSEKTETVVAGQPVDLENAVRVAEIAAAAAGDAVHRVGSVQCMHIYGKYEVQPDKSGAVDAVFVVVVVVVENHAAEIGSVAAGLGGAVVGIAVGEGDPVLGPELLVSLPVLAILQVLVWLMQQQ